MKDKIIERLLDQGHIIIRCADRILNHKGEYLQDIEDLHRDGNISTSEAITLLNESETLQFPFETPKQTFPNHDWTWDPNRTGNPYWTVTCSHDLDKNRTDK